MQGNPEAFRSKHVISSGNAILSPILHRSQLSVSLFKAGLVDHVVFTVYRVYISMYHGFGEELTGYEPRFFVICYGYFLMMPLLILCKLLGHYHKIYVLFLLRDLRLRVCIFSIFIPVSYAMPLLVENC